MEYGFVKPSETEINNLGLVSYTNNFENIFKRINNLFDKKDIGSSLNMRANEKKISFLNRYLILKKQNITTKNAKKSVVKGKQKGKITI